MGSLVEGCYNQADYQLNSVEWRRRRLFCLQQRGGGGQLTAGLQVQISRFQEQRKSHASTIHQMRTVGVMTLCPVFGGAKNGV
jgi:hypothetical protein